MEELVGYQERIEWMGTSLVTLSEIWPEEPRAVVVGVNPSVTSVESGHYFQGRGARGRLMMLVRSGLLYLPDGERHFERAALAAGIGFADLVRRPTPSAKDISASERSFGRRQFEAKVAERGVPLVIGIYAPPIEALLGERPVAGYQASLTSWGARVFNLPRPYQRADLAAEVMSTLQLD